jgi:mRNA interferase RelE/StbE
MAYQIRFEETAAKELKKLDNSVKIPILKFLKKLEQRDDPRTMGKALTGNLHDFWRFRAGDYRILTQIQDNVLVILVVMVEHRRKVYKKASNLDLTAEELLHILKK